MTIYPFFSLLLIFFAGFLAYSNTFLASFHFDDDAYIVNNFAIRNIHHLTDIWNVCPCRFLTFFSLALNYHFNRLDVFGYHLFNLAVHVLSAVCVWWLALMTFSTPVMKNEKMSSHARIMALFSGLVFVSHPIQIEAVTYIWQRAASMSGLFYLASLCCYIQSRLLQEKWAGQGLMSAGRPSVITQRFFYGCSLILAIAAMFVKENAITLPLMILMYETGFFKDRQEAHWYQLYPYLLIMLIIPRTMMLTMSARFQELQSIVSGPGGISPFHYFFTQLRVIFTYIRLLFFPVNLNLDYDYPVYKSFFSLSVFGSFLLLSAILYGAKRLYRTHRLGSFSVFWFFLTLLPESSLLPQLDVIFEHRLYLPMAGFSLFLVCGVYYLLFDAVPPNNERVPKRRTTVMVIILSLIVTCNVFLTYQRNKTWKNEIILWNDIVQKSPRKARPYINRGWAYYNSGDFIRAKADYNKAIELNPYLIYPYDDKGLIEAGQGKTMMALKDYNKAIEINPNYPKVYDDRGRAFFIQKNYSRALLDYNKAIELNPEYVDAYDDRAKLYEIQGKPIKALSDYKKSISIDPNQGFIINRISDLKKEWPQIV